MLKNLWIGLAAGVILISTALAETKTLTLKDGRTVTGDVTVLPDGNYRVEMMGGTVSFAKDQVVSVSAVASPQQQYEQRLAKIDPNSAEDHYKIGEWAWGKNQKAYLGIAEKELAEAVRLDPEMDKASILLGQVRSKLGATATAPAAAEGTEATPAAPSGQEGGMRPEWLLGEDDIYHIRIEEFRPHEDQVSVTFRNNVVDRFIKSQAGTQRFKRPGADDDFRKLSDMDKLNYMMDHDPDNVEMKNDIQIQTDPRFMREFRTSVWPKTIAPGCADTKCHGGATMKPGVMRLFNVAGNSSDIKTVAGRVDYTNFAILNGTVVNGRNMIDRGDPDHSLLLEYSLPPEVSNAKHPVPITPLFMSREAEGYVRVRKWVHSLRNDPIPDYRLKYSPPFGMALMSKDYESLLGPSTPKTRPAANPVPKPTE